MRKLAIVYLMGGFGNQIFQYSFGKDLEKKGFKVYFDSSNYVTRKFENNTIPLDRELIFSPRFFEFEEVNNNIRNLLSVFNGKKISESTYSPIRFFNDKNYKIINARLLNKYTGYWQNIELVERHKNFIIERLSNDKLLKESFSKSPESGSCLLHIRRGDYLATKEALTINFYQEALEELSNKIKNFNYSIYTDDYEWAKKQKIFFDANKIKKSTSSIKDTIQDFAEMITFENFLVGNSTFPLIASILGSTSKSLVAVADPWFRNSHKNFGFSDNWIRITNKI